jgi:hypothetical protein
MPQAGNPWPEAVTLPPAVLGSGSLTVVAGVGYLPTVRSVSVGLLGNIGVASASPSAATPITKTTTDTNTAGPGAAAGATTTNGYDLAASLAVLPALLPYYAGGGDGGGGGGGMAQAGVGVGLATALRLLPSFTDSAGFRHLGLCYGPAAATVASQYYATRRTDAHLNAQGLFTLGAATLAIQQQQEEEEEAPMQQQAAMQRQQLLSLRKSWSGALATELELEVAECHASRVGRHGLD